MLVNVSLANLSDTEKTGIILIRGWSAVDIENVAYLKRTAGNTKFGLPKYFLILPTPKPESIQDILQAYIYPDFIRSVIRAWTLEEAISIANKRLPKLISKRQRSMERLVV